MLMFKAPLEGSCRAAPSGVTEGWGKGQIRYLIIFT